MLSVSYAGKKAYSAGKTNGVLRGGASVANRCYVLVLAHCAPTPVSGMVWLVGKKLSKDHERNNV